MAEEKKSHSEREVNEVLLTILKQLNNPILCQLAEKGEIDQIKTLLVAGFPTDTQDEHGDTALMSAAKGGHGEIAQALLAAKANPDIQSGESGNTALMSAANGGHGEIAQALLAAKANPDIQDKDGTTAFMCAANKGHSDVVKILGDVVKILGLHNQNNRISENISGFFKKTGLLPDQVAKIVDEYAQETEVRKKECTIM